MSTNVPPPQPPAGQNPYAQPVPPAGNPYAAAPQGAPSGNPFAGQAAPQGAPGVPFGQTAPAGAGFAYAQVPAAGRRGNPALGVLAGVAAMVVCALLYGLLIKGTKHELGYAALAVGILVGVAVGKIGGRNNALPVVALVLSALGVYFGQVYGITLLASSVPGVPSTTDLLLHHYGLVQHAWKESLDAKSVIFLIIAAVEGFVFTRRVSN
jgi:hypothetical protein